MLIRGALVLSGFLVLCYCPITVLLLSYFLPYFFFFKLLILLYLPYLPYFMLIIRSCVLDFFIYVKPKLSIGQTGQIGQLFINQHLTLTYYCCDCPLFF